MTDANETRRLTAGGWQIRWNETLAQQAYADGWWRKETCADALDRLATEDPDRILVIDGDTRLSAASLRDQAGRLAQDARTADDGRLCPCRG